MVQQLVAAGSSTSTPARLPPPPPLPPGEAPPTLLMQGPRGDQIYTNQRGGAWQAAKRLKTAGLSTRAAAENDASTRRCRRAKPACPLGPPFAADAWRCCQSCGKGAAVGAARAACYEFFWSNSQQSTNHACFSIRAFRRSLAAPTSSSNFWPSFHTCRADKGGAGELADGWVSAIDVQQAHNCECQQARLATQPQIAADSVNPALTGPSSR